MSSASSARGMISGSLAGYSIALLRAESSEADAGWLDVRDDGLEFLGVQSSQLEADQFLWCDQRAVVLGELNIRSLGRHAQ